MTTRRAARTVTAVAEAEPQDAVLLARIKVGDETALGLVYDQHADLVYGLARRVTRDEQLARDITQEVFAYLWELPGRVDLVRGTLRAYLAVVAHRRAVDEVRRSVRRNRLEASLAFRPSEDGPEDGVVEAVTHSWRQERLATAMAAAPGGAAGRGGARVLRRTDLQAGCESARHP